MIPARGGSKGIPRKNLAPLAGRPLIAYTSEAARLSRSLSRVIVSTDDEEIAAIARWNGADVPFLRPPELALDHTPMIDVLVDMTALNTPSRFNVTVKYPESKSDAVFVSGLKIP